MSKIIIFILLCVFNVSTVSAQEALIQSAKRGIVMISDNLMSPIYSFHASKEINGTGFVVDKAQGIIVTNQHLASKNRISEIKVQFFNGINADAKILYSDPLLDFSFLKVNPAEVPEQAIEFELSKERIQNDQPVMIIGNNEGNNYSVQTGIVSNVYQQGDLFPAQIIAISLNTRGGSSGSPVLNNSGKVIALNFARTDTYAQALPISYVRDALHHIHNKQIPPRKDIGAVLSYYSLDEAVKYSRLPKEVVNTFMNKYPESLGSVLKVDMVLKDFPAYGILKPGDIIWSVNSIEVGPNLYKYQHHLNYCPSEEVNIGVYRDNKLLNLQVPLYDLQKYQLKRVINFGGATFSEVGDLLHMMTGAKKGSVFITYIQPGSSFDSIPPLIVGEEGIFYLVKLVSINGKDINDLDELINQIPSLEKSKYFKLTAINYNIMRSYHIPLLNGSEVEYQVNYSSINPDPLIITFDERLHEWTSKKISTKNLRR